jgi:hypothetical protein
LATVVWNLAVSRIDMWCAEHSLLRPLYCRIKGLIDPYRL